ncbi:MAG TPA: nitroreductase family protein [Candidatus Saccharimonadaceae bacterium]|nr:nitroreductase family protein [Candidatus Saccharimonadaceae bacterium]
MKPRRKVFARDYILETLDFYEFVLAEHHNSEEPLIDKDELKWAHDVLQYYFGLVDAKKDRIIAQAYERYKTIELGSVVNENAHVKAPFMRKDSAASKVSYEEILSLANRRRSVRWFKDEPVPRRLVDKAILVARQSPSACNRLPYEFRIFDDPELVKRIAGIPFGAAGYSHQIPTLVVVVGKLDSYFSPRDRHGIYIDSSLASMSFMLALETLGLSSSVINWPDFEPLEVKMQRELGLDVSERVVMLIAVGRADSDGIIPFSQKKSLDVIRNYNRVDK